MGDVDGLELSASLQTPGLLEIGAHTQLRIRVHNAGAADAGEMKLRASCSSGLILVSTDLGLRGEAAGRELSFHLPGLLRVESREVEVELYALCSGQSRVDVRLECAHILREALVTCVADGRAEFALDANRLELDSGEADAGASVGGRLVLTNTGRATAVLTEILLEGDLEDLHVERPALELHAGERAILRVSGRVPENACDGAALALRALVCMGATLAEHREVRLGDAWMIARSRPRFAGTIELLQAAGGRVQIGERLDCRVHVTNVGGARAQSVSVALHAAGAVYLPGSSRIQTASVVDAAGTSPLWSTGGLTFEGVAPEQTIEIAVAMIAESGAGSVALWARIVCDANETLLESVSLPVMEIGAAPQLGFAVRGVELIAGEQPPPAQTEPAVEQRFSRSDGAALDAATLRYLESLGGMMRHLWALGVLCADVNVRVALRSVFDRLAIKLRMPRYAVRSDDVLDAAASEALAALGGAPGSAAKRLGRAVQLIASEGDESQEIVRYRDAFAAKLQSLDDDDALIAALHVAQPVLDERLAAAIERSAVALST